MVDYYQDLWNKTKNILIQLCTEDIFESLFSKVDNVYKMENGFIYVIAPSTFIKSRINKAYIENINEILSNLTIEKLKFKFITQEEINNSNNFQNSQTKSSYNRFIIHNLNENYTFESFVVGRSNNVARGIAKNVAEQPGVLANPLYIFGGVGLGKTHLSQAIGNYILDRNINNKILYVQATDFISDYSKAIYNDNMDAFEKKYNNLDCLLIDDIQMLEVGKKSQEEFFKLFNDLINRKKQIVITSDCPAKELKGIMERLTSRFSSGVPVNIERPDLEQRIDILKRKSKEIYTREIDEEILRFIANNFPDNVRDLEGALNLIIAQVGVFKIDKITLDFTKNALSSLLSNNKNTLISESNYENVINIVADFYNISSYDLISNGRKSSLVLPRHICMYILKNNFKLPYKKIGSILGNRDHSTIISGCNKIDNDLKNNPDLVQAINTILKKLNL